MKYRIVVAVFTESIITFGRFLFLFFSACGVKRSRVRAPNSIQINNDRAAAICERDTQ